MKEKECHTCGQQFDRSFELERIRNNYFTFTNCANSALSQLNVLFHIIIMWCLFAAIPSTTPMILSQRQMWRRVLIMSLLLIVICGIFLCQPTVNGVLNKTVFLFSVQAGWTDDYWSEDFDNNKNCQQEKKIIELYKKVGVPIKIVLCSIAETILPFCRKMMVLPRASAQRKWYLS